tara:strand:+ start:856 stop:1200 length:345 start_codon:yes stop_codon:yes gene_type:complete
MTKNILKNFLLTDLYENEEGMTVNNEITVDNKNDELCENDNCSDLESDCENNQDYDVVDDSIPKIEFIVEEDENKEKQVRMNFEFKVNESSEIIKIDLEISKNTYLELADELLK